MTHTEESLMALADRMYSAPAGTLKNMIEIELRLAISEVLAERDRYLDIIRREAWLEHAAENDVASPYVPFTDWVAEKNRAEKAEAECELLRKDGERYEWIEGRVNLYGNNWAFGVMRTAINRNDGPGLTAAIDAAMKEQP